MSGTLPENNGRNDRLDARSLEEGLYWLAERDEALAMILETLGPPPLWDREIGFPTLVHIILEQQVSLASARAAFKKLQTRLSPLAPENFLELDDDSLKTIGFSRQKTAYTRHLARSIIDGYLDLNRLGEMEDEAARFELMKIKGIGRWTADIYLMMAMGRPDIWPKGDLALLVAAQHVKKLAARPTHMELEAISNSWRPWRAVAARLLWHYYLSR
jgi:DNA-3-methyladenine glycosylase II